MEIFHCERLATSPCASHSRSQAFTQPTLRAREGLVGGGEAWPLRNGLDVLNYIITVRCHVLAPKPRDDHQAEVYTCSRDGKVGSGFED